jgi:hypothetical protein
MTCHVMSIGRVARTSSIQREVSQVHGQTGSNQKSTGRGAEELVMLGIL